MSVLVVAVALGCAAWRWWITMLVHRDRLSVLFVFGMVVPALAWWTAVALLMRWPLDWVVGWGGWWLLAPIAVLVGSFERWTLVGTGAAVAYGLFVTDEPVLLAWVAPMVAATAVRLLRDRTWRSLLRAGRGDSMRDLNRALGHHAGLRPLRIGDHAWRVVHLAVGLVPAVLAVVLPFPGAAAGQWWLRVATGLLIAVTVWRFDFMLWGITRDMRRGARIGLVVTQLVAIGVAVTPLGAALVWSWRLLPGPAGLVGGLVLIGLDVVTWGAITRTRRLRDTGAQASRLLQFAGATIREGLLRRGLLVYAAVCLFHPAPDLLVGVAMFVGAELVLGLTVILRRDLATMSAWDAGQMIRYWGGERHELLLRWLHDSITERPESPNYRVVASLAVQAVRSVQGRTITGPPLFAGSDALTGTRALQWLDIADEALELVKSRLPGLLARQPMRREHLRAKWMCQVARASVYTNLNWRDDALAAHRAAAAHAQEADAPNAAAVSRIEAASLLRALLARPRDALRELADPLSDTTLAAPVRRSGLLVAALAHADLGDRDTARSVVAQARAVVVNRRAWRLFFAEEKGSSVSFATTGKQAVLADLRQFEAMAAAVLEGGDFEVALTDTGSAAMVLHNRAMAAQLRGDIPRARRLALAAVEVATRDGLLTWAYNCNLQLAVLSDEMPESYRHARAAVDVLEEMRGRVIDPDLRVGAAPSVNYNAYEIAAMSLLTGGPLEGVPDWPDRPYAEAFELVERARSRVFLELLGSAAAASEVAVRETEAAAEFQLALRAQAGASESERPAALERVRQARNRVDEVWRELAESGPDGERYARLRRGTPASVEEVRSHLGDGVVLVEFFVTEAWTVVFVLRAEQDEPWIGAVEMGRDAVRAAVAVDRINPQALRPLLDPVLEACAEGERLCVVPHDALHLVPLHAIEVDGRPFADRNPASYLPAAGLLRYTNDSGPGTAGAVVMADSRADRPLAHARVQAGGDRRTAGAAGRAAAR
ncbi:hypothetical protein [Lentzea sp. CA-135723]|uniref:hypothetical protein n=1 Tax=Lentzea sp. CA-135723 TaxID=3239950 RepID=UPI003D9288D8